MKQLLTRSLLLLALLCGRPVLAAPAHPLQAESDAEFFKNKILPIFTTRCQTCHNQVLKLSGLSLEMASALLAGGNHGPVVVPGNPLQSRLYRRVARLEKPFMPMEGDPLLDSEVIWLKTWIERGASWPEGVGSSTVGVKPIEAPSHGLELLSTNAVLFREKIQPILSARCVHCHNAGRKSSGFSLETRAGLLNGGFHGPVILAGKPPLPARRAPGKSVHASGHHGSYRRTASGR
jgi:uncharacterized membrane protein